MINDFFNVMLPQFVLGLFIIIQIVLSIFISPRYYRYSRLVSTIGIALSVIMLALTQTEPQYFGFKNSIMSDWYTLLFHFLILLCGFFAVILTKNLLKEIKQNAYTFNAILLTAILGAMCTISANDFITLFVSLELLSFPTYFLISVKKGYCSKEAAFKYLITNAVSSGIFLFGVSYLYGLTSSLNISEIYETLNNSEPSLILSFAGCLIIFGLISKLAIFPFANWIIEVFKGCETSILAFFSTVPELAVLGVLCRLLVFPLSANVEMVFIIMLISIITIFWANTYAIRENNVKVILACSSSANCAYMLIVAALVSVYNLSTVIFYLICYVFLNIGAFAFLNIAEYNRIKMLKDEYRGLYYKNPLPVIAYVISIIGLAGIPITSGFVAKIYLFSAIARSGLIFIPVLIILLLLTVYGLYYYLKLIKPLFENSENAVKLNSFSTQNIALYVAALITLFVGVFPEKLIELCKFIAYNI